MICAGIDAGRGPSRWSCWDADALAGAGRGRGGPGRGAGGAGAGAPRRLLAQRGLGRDDLGAVVATGYGRKLIGLADQTITEITCQAWGVRQRLPGVRTIIDIGGQDSKLLRLAADGGVDDFVMNDRCAAGTGRFLEVLADAAGRRPARTGRTGPRTAASRHSSAACAWSSPRRRSWACWRRAWHRKTLWPACRPPSPGASRPWWASIHPRPIVFTGGVAMVPGMDAALAAALGAEVSVSPDPQLTGARARPCWPRPLQRQEHTRPVNAPGSGTTTIAAYTCIIATARQILPARNGGPSSARA